MSDGQGLTLRFDSVPVKSSNPPSGYERRKAACATVSAVCDSPGAFESFVSMLLRRVGQNELFPRKETFCTSDVLRSHESTGNNVDKAEDHSQQRPNMKWKCRLLARTSALGNDFDSGSALSLGGGSRGKKFGLLASILLRLEDERLKNDLEATARIDHLESLGMEFVGL